MRNLFFIICLITIGVLNIHAQDDGCVKLDQRDYKIKVKQLDEFMQRFNLHDSPEMFQNKDTLVQKMYCLTALFDFNIIKTRQKEVRDFVTSIINNDTKISYTDTTWCAKAECNAVYKGKNVTVTLELVTEHVKDYIYKWVIKGASGGVLNLPSKKQNDGMIISPVDNEVNFISLKHITTTEAQNILNYKSKNEKMDSLSVFFALVHSGVLSIVNVQQLEYVFNVEGYQFTVHNFVRDAMNSGWLISDFKKI